MRKDVQKIYRQLLSVVATGHQTVKSVTAVLGDAKLETVRSRLATAASHGWLSVTEDEFSVYHLGGTRWQTLKRYKLTSKGKQFLETEPDPLTPVQRQIFDAVGDRELTANEVASVLKKHPGSVQNPLALLWKAGYLNRRWKKVEGIQFGERRQVKRLFYRRRESDEG